ncbi:MAG TPA: HEAT repeat domain-containing protein [Gemmatimonadaceae bacterium]|nr:HEAT repeat domain-containing protein [Gemmatimonadaceae bacterium]
MSLFVADVGQRARHMDHSVTFARHYARLLWLLLHEAANVDEQKASLRALVTVSKDGAVSLTANGESLWANATSVPTALAGVADVSRQMAAHGIGEVAFDAGAAAAGVLGSARILAGEAAGDGGATALAKLQTMGAAGVRFVARPAAPAAPPAAAVAAPAPVAASAPAPAPSTPAPPITEPGTLPDFGLGEVDMLDEKAMQAKLRPTPRANVAIPASAENRPEGGGMFEQFAASRVPTATHTELLAQLEQSTGANVLTRVLDDLVTIAEAAARDARPALVCEILCRVTRREPQIHDFESKRAFVMAQRRFAKPQLLRAITQELPHAGAQRDTFIAVLTRAGEDGADAVIEQIAAISGQNERRVYFDALLQLQSGIPTLIHMLGDARWFVARNAAELLGEMQAREAEPQLTELLRHSDDRVRRAATSALMRLGTTRAMHAIQEALKDGAPAMRMQAAAALVTRKDVKTAATLVRALEDEKDDEVQAAFLLALGKLATPDAVQRLLKAAEPERVLFKKKSTAFRVAAVQGLGEARTPEATEALKGLVGDKDADVAASAKVALQRIAKHISPAAHSEV